MIPNRVVCFLRREIHVYAFLIGLGGTTPGAAVISASFLLCLLTTSGASQSCVFVLLRYQVEGVESKKQGKKKILGRPTNPTQNEGWCKERGCMSRTVLPKFSMGSRSLVLERKHCFVSSCFSFISLGCVFPESPAIVHGLLLGYDTGFGERGGVFGGVV